MPENDPNYLAQLLEQIQSVAADAQSALTEVTGLKQQLSNANEEIKSLKAYIEGFKITDDSGVSSGSGNQWRFNFSNLPDPILTATVDCDTDPPTITITSTNG